MESLYLLIPMSIVLVFFIGLLFWWSTRSGQFDDLEREGLRILEPEQGFIPSSLDEGQS